MTTWRANLGITVATAALALLLLAALGRGDQITAFERTTAPLRQDLVRWEASHLLDKWWSRVGDLVLRRDTSAEARATAVAVFFDLGEELRGAEADRSRVLAAPEGGDLSSGAITPKIEALEAQRRELQPFAEETIEAAITSALEDAGVIDFIGPLRWPPVDFTFERGALVLVRSPRDEVRRLEDSLLRPDVDLLAQVRLESRIEEQDSGISAFVVRVGGIATYPTQVSPSHSLHDTLILASHEWTHHWLTFRALGLRWWAGGELTSINETLATIVGEEIGDLALTALTGEVFEREPWRPPEPAANVSRDPGSFDFQVYMNETRSRLDELLDDGHVAEAEAWLEERRLALMEHGVHIRKLNTAYFAFHGTYAADPRGGSVNPIDAQLRTLRAKAGDLASFVDSIAAIKAVGQLEAMARDAGWTPTTGS